MSETLHYELHCKNGGTDYCPKGKPRRVKVHDFEDEELGKVAPYGVYDVTANTGFVSVGITSDTAEFAVHSIGRWLDRIGRQRYPKAGELTITTDCGGSNGTRVRLWKVGLQKLSHETGLVLHVHHYPPGTSKWNKIEHRLLCHITQNWRGRPLTDRIAIVELIGATTTKTGLKVEWRSTHGPTRRASRSATPRWRRLEAIFEEVFDPSSFTYRKGRKTADGLTKIWERLEARGS
jgi:hypothetical protein